MMGYGTLKVTEGTTKMYSKFKSTVTSPPDNFSGSHKQDQFFLLSTISGVCRREKEMENTM